MRCIAIPFELNERWIGGSYYIRSLVSAMALLPESEQPLILLVCEKQESIRFIQESGYRHIGWVRPNEFDELAEAGNTDIVFPHPIANQESRTISWIPDFQELHLGYFFTNQEINNRRNHHRRRFTTAGLIVSSEDVRKDVDIFFPGECQNIAVVRFASFDLPDVALVEEMQIKYKLIGRYVICANQLWLHKNHIVIIRALALLKERNINITVVFTGNETDYRVAGYTEFLKNQAVEWGIADRLRFLGFIPRSDQLCLMKGAHYVLQPSLFEGWSTVIEDAKAMGKFVVASDLGVHKEQLTEACRFFFRHDPVALADVMAELAPLEKLPERTLDYGEVRIRFARNFMEAVHKFAPVSSGRCNQKTLAKIHQLTSANLEKNNKKNLNALPKIPHVSVPETHKLKSVLASAVDNKKKHVGINDAVENKEVKLTGSNCLSSGFLIELDHRSEIYDVLKISSHHLMKLNNKYIIFIIKLVRIKNSFFAELRLKASIPIAISKENGGCEDKYGVVMSMPLRVSIAGDGSLFGTVNNLSAASLEDVNTALQAGVAYLSQKTIAQSSLLPVGLKPVINGVRLYKKGV